ncbi:hypothetical protein FRB96_007505 [Tulasnella sp. 330]|nr:hypothetical protein FRB96_007505 [Tulasnella sp. 330]KAG8881568.1 hypothetical protein FRB97_009402 [Tulasnella sp. 331]KAG8887559.1 hypothetical protein FRB98_009465 [Tulasnella sp. 332]
MDLPSKNAEYGTQRYWEERYTRDEGTHDWFKSYDEIKELLHDLIPDRNSRILMLGCGNSTLSENMWQAGYKNIVNIDYSEVVIEKMRVLYPDRAGMEWHVMDIRELGFESDTFDVVIDKGTMDAMMAPVEDVWNPPQQVIDDCTKEVEEVIRVLRPSTGIFLYLTFGQPHFRK